MNSTKMSHIFEKTIPVLFNDWFRKQQSNMQYNVQKKNNSYKTHLKIKKTL